MLITSWGILNAILVLNTTFMFLALIKFIKIVSSTDEKRDLNRFLTGLQTLALLVWFISFALTNIDIIYHWGNNYEYNNVVRIIIIDSVGFYSSLIIFMIIALAIYKSSRCASNFNTGQAQRATNLLRYLNRQYSKKQQRSITMRTDPRIARA